MEEQWKDILGYEGLYQISNLGRVKNVNTQYILNPSKSVGYFQVGLYKNKSQEKFHIHRLVAQAFIPNPNNYPCVNHKDETRTNNDISNLEWCTYGYNQQYGTCPQRIGKSNSKQVIQKTLDGEVVKVYDSMTQAQQETGISQSLISMQVQNKYKSAGGFLWELAKENKYV